MEPAMSFGNAIERLRDGKRVARKGWNGKGMFLVLVERWACQPDDVAQLGPTLPFIAMRTVHGELVPWLASQTDMLALDWSEVS